MRALRTSVGREKDGTVSDGSWCGWCAISDVRPRLWVSRQCTAIRDLRARSEAGGQIAQRASSPKSRTKKGRLFLPAVVILHCFLDKGFGRLGTLPTFDAHLLTRHH